MLAIRPGHPKATSARRNVSSYSGYAKPTKANSRRLQKWRWISLRAVTRPGFLSRHRRPRRHHSQRKDFWRAQRRSCRPALMGRGMPSGERIAAFEYWLGRLNEAPTLTAATPLQAWLSFWSVFSPITSNIPLPPTLPRPSWIYGHLPFSTTTLPETIIYRWEAFPTSRRINRTANPPTIAADTYASPASEIPFALTGFAALARFALPNLLPACFRWELQPVAGTRSSNAAHPFHFMVSREAESGSEICKSRQEQMPDCRSGGAASAVETAGRSIAIK